MGFDTYVEIGDRRLVQWRKDTGDLPRLLFRRSDAVVTTDGNLVTGVEFHSTAAGVLAVLAEQGLGWDASVAGYAAVRGGGAISAYLVGRYSTQADENRQVWNPDDPFRAQSSEERAMVVASFEAARTRVATEASATPAEDLQLLGSLLAEQWLDTDSKVFLLDELAYDDPINPYSMLIPDSVVIAEDSDRAALPIGRAVETLLLLLREARLVAWPIIISTLLAELPPDTEVRYILTEGIEEFDMEAPPLAEAFVQDWWDSTGKAVADYAHVLGQLFGALSAFESQLGTDFWFGQATVALAQLRQLNLNRTQSTNKARGDALERLVDVLLRAEHEVQVLEKNYRTKEEEIDLILTNGLSHPFWLNQSSAFILVECKNWASPVGVEPLRVLESKLEDRKGAARIGLFVSTAGFTQPFVDRLKTVQSRGIGLIYALDWDDLESLIARRLPMMEWLRSDGAIRAFRR